ncbi:CPBP family intramembrane glutamic endopeptidase [Flammeovirga aprica]|uniref:CPBP family intramembrane metalloprotease n=1 Tax=Flammeovirga aprica JL-4 TaxID=694437 RepID=A0A7X9XCJ1_9BACT|nr:type II CAAX endopeptidase family protein [Flammeovirga aprica]NME71862.1 CPBP family intramembrane metalloprotease [Flammeovirga aprica JL-4]
MTTMNSTLQLTRNPNVKLNWATGLTLVLFICIPRFILVLNANETANYSAIGGIMFFSAILPFMILTKQGLKAIGIVKTNKFGMLLLALILGIGASLLLYGVGVMLYGGSIENWYVYIGKSYNIPVGISGDDKLILFTVMAITGMIFSPIGEEFFFRGIVHYAFAQSLDDKRASYIDSSAFALTHISHFGYVYYNSEWIFLPYPTLLWVISMFLVSLLFFQMKKKTDSIWGAVLCHSGFNLGMIYCIFYLL